MPGTAARLQAQRSSERLYIPSLQQVVTGMPELCRAGLSETWLLKACGHRHWLALAEAHSLAVPVFRGADGARLYPAFTYLRLSHARLDIVDENRLIAFEVSLTRASRSRFRSEIQVTCDGDAMARVTMETVFVRRATEGANTSARRAVAGGPCLLIPQGPGRHAPPDQAWVDGPPLASILLDPSPDEDFNGVGFLYFAAFQAMADRAEWSWGPRYDVALTTREREIVFLGNAEVGERIAATLLGQARHGNADRRRIKLSRESDGATIAQITAHRSPAEPRA